MGFWGFGVMGAATMALRMPRFLVHIWSSWLPSLWVATLSLMAGVNPALVSWVK